MPAKEQLSRTDLVIAEVSYPSTGQGIELGLASSADVPIVCVHKKGSRPSSSLRFVTTRIVDYDDTDDMIAKISDIIDGNNAD